VHRLFVYLQEQVEDEEELEEEEEVEEEKSEMVSIESDN